MAVLALGAAAVPAEAAHSGLPGTYFSGTYTNAWGTRRFEGYVPSTYRKGTAVPLVVYLHGCLQTADSAAAGTRFNQQAEARRFIVVYPEQSALANATRCWNWFATAQQVRGGPEPSIIAGITSWVQSRYSVDSRRIYVSGASAGGAMSVIMGATYPDKYAAIGVVAGCEYGGYPCGSSGGPDPVGQGAAAYSAMGSYARSVPVIVFQGDQDTTVPPINAEQVIQQWISTNDRADDGSYNGSVPTTRTSTSSGQVPGGRSYEIDFYRAADGSNLLQRYLVHGMGHAYPGGSSEGSYTDPLGPDATTISTDFFLAHPKP